MSKLNTESIQQQFLDLQHEVEALRKQNADLEARLKAYSLVNTGQISLINKLIDKVPFGIMLLDEENNIIHANDAAGKIFSSIPANMTGQKCNHFFNSCEQPDFLSSSKLPNEANPQHAVSENNGKYLMHSAFISDEGSEKVIVVTFIDVTEIKLAEQGLIKTNKIKDEFLGMVSHELRTPLNVMQGYSSLVEEELQKVKNIEALSYINKVNLAGEALLTVVNNLLELSDLTAGKIKVDYVPIDLDMIVTQLKYRFEKLFEEKNNKLIFRCDEVKPFEQDLALLMKVLYELVSNANKFTEHGEVRVSVSLQKQDDIDFLCFDITDTGCGMTEDTIQQIFSAFSQADSSLTRSYEGLGLGLTLAEKSVTLIQGKIEVESELGKGSRFVTFIPYSPVKAA